MNPTGKTALYFIALVPPEPVFSQVMALKEEVSRDYDSHKQLNSPPHITLVPPFKMPDSEEETLIAELKALFSKQLPFSLKLNGFKAFPPKVIYVHNELAPLLHQLEKHLRNRMSTLMPGIYKGRDYSFNPHMTIAYRDLSRENFKLAWPAFKDRHYIAEFEVASIDLLKHNGKRWETLHAFLLQGK